MADVIFTSIKKILTDANLPLTLKFDNDKSKIDSYKAMFGGDFPQGSSDIELVNFDTGVGFESSIVGLKFNDLYENSYTITAYNGSTATITPELVVDMISEDVVDLRVGDEIKLIQLPSSFNLNKGTISCKMRYRVKGFDVYLTSYDDVSGDKAEMLVTKLGKLFSKQAYPCYDENGLATGEHFNLELTLNFSDISTVATTKVLLSRLRFGKYEDYNNI